MTQGTPLPFETGPQSPLWDPQDHAELTIPEGNLVDPLRHNAEAFPESAAMHYHGRTITYGELAAQVDALAGWLAARGLQPGDRVIVNLQNSPQYVIAFHAILRANGVVVPLNPMHMDSELSYYIQDSGARMVICGEELLERFTPHLPGELTAIVRVRYADMADDTGDQLPSIMRQSAPPPVEGVTDLQQALAENLPAPPLSTGGRDLAVLPYTSGTTGRPKACMHSHSGALFVAKAQVLWYRLDRQSVMTSFMPLFHVAGMMASMASALYCGASLILMTRWDAEAIPALFRRYRPTWWSAAPTMVVDVLAAEGFSDDCFSSLKVVTGGGASMPAPVAERLLQQWGLRFCEGYGLTETISATHINSLDRPKPQCLGIPIQNTHSRIVDPETLAPLEPGQIGEILISGPQVMDGYWNRPEDTRETLIEQDGRIWLRSGDLGHVDTDGCYFITDRLKRMINAAGYNVWPAECEMMLYSHPAVAECAVISAPDSRRGEQVRAIVALRPEYRGKLSAEDLIAFARTKVAAYKVPRQIEFRDALPRSGSGKVDWRKLQAEAWAEERTKSDSPV